MDGEAAAGAPPPPPPAAVTAQTNCFLARLHWRHCMVCIKRRAAWRAGALEAAWKAGAPRARGLEVLAVLGRVLHARSAPLHTHTHTHKDCVMQMNNLFANTESAHTESVEEVNI